MLKLQKEIDENHKSENLNYWESVWKIEKTKNSDIKLPSTVWIIYNIKLASEYNVYYKSIAYS